MDPIYIYIYIVLIQSLFKLTFYINSLMMYIYIYNDIILYVKCIPKAINNCHNYLVDTKLCTKWLILWKKCLPNLVYLYIYI